MVNNALSRDEVLVIQLGEGSNEEYYGADHKVFSYLDLDPKTIGNDFEIGQGLEDRKLTGYSLTSFAHELEHFVRRAEEKTATSKIPYKNQIDPDDGSVYTHTFPEAEISAVLFENKIRATFGVELRTHYEGVEIFGKRLSQAYDYYTNGGLRSERPYYLLEDDLDFSFDLDIYRGRFISSAKFLNLILSIKKEQVKTVDYSNYRTLNKNIKIPADAIRLTIEDNDL